MSAKYELCFGIAPLLESPWPSVKQYLILHIALCLPCLQKQNHYYPSITITSSKGIYFGRMLLIPPVAFLTVVQSMTRSTEVALEGQGGTTPIQKHYIWAFTLIRHSTVVPNFLPG